METKESEYQSLQIHYEFEASLGQIRLFQTTNKQRPVQAHRLITGIFILPRLSFTEAEIRVLSSTLMKARHKNEALGTQQNHIQNCRSLMKSLETPNLSLSSK